MRTVLATLVVAAILVSVNCGSAYQDDVNQVASVTSPPLAEIPVTSSPFGADQSPVPASQQPYNDFWQYLLAMRLQQLENYYNSLPPVNSVYIPPNPVKKNCQPVGGFCTYHEDCCSFACLGYLKRCVSK